MSLVTAPSLLLPTTSTPSLKTIRVGRPYTLHAEAGSEVKKQQNKKRLSANCNGYCAPSMDFVAGRVKEFSKGGDTTKLKFEL